MWPYIYARGSKRVKEQYMQQKKQTVTIQCVLLTRPIQDGKCQWSVLENLAS